MPLAAIIGGPAYLDGYAALPLKRALRLPPQSWDIEFDATRHLHMAPLLEHGPAGAAMKLSRSSSPQGASV